MVGSTTYKARVALPIMLIFSTELALRPLYVVGFGGPRLEVQ